MYGYNDRPASSHSGHRDTLERQQQHHIPQAIISLTSTLPTVSNAASSLPDSYHSRATAATNGLVQPTSRFPQSDGRADGGISSVFDPIRGAASNLPLFKVNCCDRLTEDDRWLYFRNATYESELEPNPAAAAVATAVTAMTPPLPAAPPSFASPQQAQLHPSREQADAESQHFIRLPPYSPELMKRSEKSNVPSTAAHRATSSKQSLSASPLPEMAAASASAAGVASITPSLSTESLESAEAEPFFSSAFETYEAAEHVPLLFKVCLSTKRGRHVHAACKLNAGVELWREQAFTAVMLDDTHLDYCHNCWRLCPATSSAAPCSGCEWARFCSPECRLNSSAEHSLLCPFLGKEAHRIAGEGNVTVNRVRLLLKCLAARFLETTALVDALQHCPAERVTAATVFQLTGEKGMKPCSQGVGETKPRHHSKETAIDQKHSATGRSLNSHGTATDVKHDAQHDGKSMDKSLLRDSFSSIPTPLVSDMAPKSISSDLPHDSNTFLKRKRRVINGVLVSRFNYDDTLEMESNQSKFRRDWITCVEQAATLILAMVPPKLRVLSCENLVRLACLSDTNSFGITAEWSQYKFSENLGKRITRAVNRPPVVALSVAGLGIYPLSARLNHSCYPSCEFRLACSSGGKVSGAPLSMSTIRLIQNGQELTDSYVDLYTDRTSRRAELLRTKHFLCNCERCAVPMNKSLDRYLDGIICPTCAKCPSVTQAEELPIQWNLILVEVGNCFVNNAPPSTYLWRAVAAILVDLSEFDFWWAQRQPEALDRFRPERTDAMSSAEQPSDRLSHFAAVSNPETEIEDHSRCGTHDPSLTVEPPPVYDSDDDFEISSAEFSREFDLPGTGPDKFPGIYDPGTVPVLLPPPVDPDLGLVVCDNLERVFLLQGGLPDNITTGEYTCERCSTVIRKSLLTERLEVASRLETRVISRLQVCHWSLSACLKLRREAGLFFRLFAGNLRHPYHASLYRISQRLTDSSAAILARLNGLRDVDTIPDELSSPIASQKTMSENSSAVSSALGASPIPLEEFAGEPASTSGCSKGSTVWDKRVQVILLDVVLLRYQLACQSYVMPAFHEEKFLTLRLLTAVLTCLRKAVRAKHAAAGLPPETPAACSAAAAALGSSPPETVIDAALQRTRKLYRLARSVTLGPLKSNFYPRVVS